MTYATLKANIMELDAERYAKDYDRGRRNQVIESDIIKIQDEVSSKQTELAKIEIKLKKAELLEDTDDVNKLAKESKKIHDEIAEKTLRYQRIRGI